MGTFSCLELILWPVYSWDTGSEFTVFVIWERAKMIKQSTHKGWGWMHIVCLHHGLSRRDQRRILGLCLALSLSPLFSLVLSLAKHKDFRFSVSLAGDPPITWSQSWSSGIYGHNDFYVCVGDLTSEIHTFTATHIYWAFFQCHSHF